MEAPARMRRQIDADEKAAGDYLSLLKMLAVN